MALFDVIFEFSDAQSVAISSASTANSDFYVDNATGMKDAFGTAVTTVKWGGYSKPLVVVITVCTAFTVTGIITCALKSKAASASISSGATSHGSVAFGAADAIGTMLTIPIPSDNIERYCGILYTASGGNVSTGAVNAYVAEAEQIVD